MMTIYENLCRCGLVSLTNAHSIVVAFKDFTYRLVQKCPKDVDDHRYDDELAIHRFRQDSAGDYSIAEVC